MHQREGRGPRLLARPAGVMAASLLATLLAAAACGGERRGTPRQPHARAARGVWGRIAPAAAAAVAGLRPLTGLNHSLATGGEGRATGGLGGRGGLSTRKVGDGGPLTQCRPGAGGGGGRRGVPNQRRYVANRPSCRPPPPLPARWPRSAKGAEGAARTPILVIPPGKPAGWPRDDRPRRRPPRRTPPPKSPPHAPPPPPRARAPRPAGVVGRQLTWPPSPLAVPHDSGVRGGEGWSRRPLRGAAGGGGDGKKKVK